MNSRQRVESVLAGVEPDRPPVTAWGHTYREEWDATELARATVLRQRRFGWDLVKFQPRASCFAEAFGARWKASGNSRFAPRMGPPAVVSASDWAHVEGRGADAPSLQEQVQSIALAAQQLGAEVPVVQTVFSPITVAGYLAGKEPARAARELKQDPERMRPALEKITAALIEFSRRSVEAGAAGVFYAISGYLGRARFTAADYERLVLPYDLAVLEAMPEAAWLNVLHVCGSHLHFDLVKRMPNVAVVSWNIHNQGNPGLAEGRDRSARVVLGGVDQRAAINKGTVAEVTLQAREALRETGGRGLILGPGCSVPPAAPDENLLALARAVAA